MHICPSSLMSQPNTDFFGEVPIAAITALLASVRDLGEYFIIGLVHMYPTQTTPKVPQAPTLRRPRILFAPITPLPPLASRSHSVLLAQGRLLPLALLLPPSPSRVLAMTLKPAR